MLSKSPLGSDLLSTLKQVPPVSAVLGETEGEVLSLDLAARKPGSMLVLEEEQTNLLRNIACSATMCASPEELRIFVFTGNPEAWDFLQYSKHLVCIYTTRQMPAAAREIEIIKDETNSARYHRAPADYPTSTLLLVENLGEFRNRLSVSALWLELLISSGYDGGTFVVASERAENINDLEVYNTSFTHLCLGHIEPNPELYHQIYNMLYLSDNLEIAAIPEQTYWVSRKKRRGWQAFTIPELLTFVT